MDRARVLARRQDGLGVGTREVREQPDGALKVGARQVVALLEEGRLALDDALMDLRVVLNRDAVKATDRHGVLDDTVLDLLYRKVGVRGDVALVAEVARQRVGAILQVLERHELALLVGEQALERFLAVDVLARDLEVIDLYLQRIRQVEARALLLLNLDVGIAKRDVLLIKFFFGLQILLQRTSVRRRCCRYRAHIQQAKGYGSGQHPHAAARALGSMSAMSPMFHRKPLLFSSRVLLSISIVVFVWCLLCSQKCSEAEFAYIQVIHFAL